ncbi:MAG: response regulator [Thermoanaerobaculia bacterium]
MSGPGGRVLVADDDDSIRTWIGIELARQGIDADFAASGDEVLRKIRTEPYATILLDLLMPGMNGFEVLREIKALHAALLSRIIVLTGASESTVRGVEKGDIFGLLQKPVGRDELVRIVTDCMNGRRPPERSSR